MVSAYKATRQWLSTNKPLMTLLKKATSSAAYWYGFHGTYEAPTKHRPYSRVPLLLYIEGIQTSASASSHISSMQPSPGRRPHEEILT